MSGGNTAVPSLVATPLAERVPISEYEACPVTGLLHRLGDKWSLVTLVLLGGRPHRFNELHHRIEGVSQRMLTRTLRALESDGLVRRTVVPHSSVSHLPPRPDARSKLDGSSARAV